MVGSDPPDLCPPGAVRSTRCATGAILPAPPSHVRLSFSEEVDVGRRGIRVLSPGGRRVERGPPSAAGREVSIAVDAAEPGTYRVIWRVISEDTQPVQGRFAFSVGAPSAAAAAGSEPPPASRAGAAVAILGRWLHFAGYALCFGVLGFRRFLAGPGAGVPDEAAGRQVWRLVAAGLAALVAAELVIALGEVVTLGSSGDPEPLADLLESRFGLVLGQRLGVALLLWAILVVVKGGSRAAHGLALALGALLAAIDGQSAHAVTGRPLWLSLSVNAIHVMAMGAWLGAVAALTVVWGQAGLAGSRHRMAVGVGRVAAASLVLLGLSGLAMAWQHLGRPADVVATGYGRALGLKLVAVAMALACALGAARAAPGDRARWWSAELAALAVALALAAVLISLPAPR
ncbi:MAG TPA: copper resistance protein CopC [Candidatus Methylomirabilis sp.]|nr:copper resistance protein CopC [Candidatus Methylomirabilis sp.]